MDLFSKVRIQNSRTSVQLIVTTATSWAPPDSLGCSAEALKTDIPQVGVDNGLSVMVADPKEINAAPFTPG
jgi:hypothetical protein